MEGGWSINYSNSIFTKIDKSGLLPGDVAMNYPPDSDTSGHVGVYLYKVNGVEYYINAAGAESGVVINRQSRFDHFYRINVD